MTSSGAGINYRDTFFEYPELDKIHGEPTPDALLVLKISLKQMQPVFRPTWVMAYMATFS